MKKRKMNFLLRNNIWKKGTAWLLVFSIVLQTMPVYAQDIVGDIAADVWEEPAEETESSSEDIFSDEGGVPEDIFESDQSQTEVPPLEQEQVPEVPQENPEDIFSDDMNVPEEGFESASPENEESEEIFESDQPAEEEVLTEQGQTPEETAALFENGLIKIYNIEQLRAIGTEAPVMTNDMQEELFGTGEEILDGEEAVTYGADADYMLMNEIPLISEEIWTLPEGFTGTFAGAPTEDSVLYDSATDTVYVYNNYQLHLMASDTCAEEPIMSNDMLPEKVGIGQLLYKDGTPAGESLEEAQEYLTYSREHNYVLSPSFTEQMPELMVETYKATQEDEKPGQKGGRDYIGQQYTTIEGEKYILIGNEQQLRAIGSDKSVTPMLFLRTEVKFLLGLLGQKEVVIPYYPGDTDLNMTSMNGTGIKHEDIEKGTEEFQYKKEQDKKNQLMGIEWGNENLLEGIVSIVGGLLAGVFKILGGSKELVGIKVDENNKTSISAHDGILGTNPEYTPFHDLRQEYEGLKYSSDANYIIFRNIDLSANGEHSNGEDDKWIPIHLSGKMEGRLDMEANKIPKIQNIHIEQSGPLNMETTSGIGFFGTITNKLNEDTLGSAGTTVVRNIHLENVSVNNTSTTVDLDVQSLVDGLLKLLDGLLGGILGALDGLLLPGNLKLDKVIHDLLTLKQESPDLFATGSFAGRIVGDVHVENCTVDQATVSSAKGISGGFVGFTEGVEEYGVLSGLLGNVVKVLSTLLNILPGVGLGDLITVLLKNDVPLGQLIPTGYHKPMIKNCSVTLNNGTIGNSAEDYNGGFVGIQTGTVIKNSKVINLSAVNAKAGAGGFAGLERDAIIKGALQNLGVDLVSPDVKSVQESCSVTGSNIAINANSYAGGFNGAMANSVSLNSDVSNLHNVVSGKYAGGFVGRATIGFGTSIGGKDKKDNLLESVSGLLGNVLAPENTDQRNQLLTLAGVMPSKIHGCSVHGSNLVVESTGDYAGGMIGQGDGVKITAVGAAEFTSGSAGGNVTGLQAVTANRYAGGIAGSVVTADAIGVLNQTLGVGQFIPFELSQVSVEGTNWTVTATEKYAAGACGLMLGGTADGVTINNIQNITAGNYTGGFAGRTGASSLASAGGLDVLGLVKLKNVLSLANGIQVTIKNCQTIGAASGLTILSNGTAVLTDGEDFIAGGFIGESVASVVENSHVKNLKSVAAKRDTNKTKGSYAGGFLGRSHTGGLAGLAEKEDGNLKLPGIVTVDSLLNLVPYLLPKYTDTTVTFISNDEAHQVEGQYAGGYAGAMQSGKVDNSTSTEAYAVYGLEKVKGESHAGGFAGKIDAGATAASDGLNLLGGILNLDIGQLVNVLQVYIPIIQSAGVKSADKGFTVEATDTDSYAGGYLGYGGGVQIKDSDVTSLKHTKVTPPGDSLESTNGESYFSEASQYAVKGGKFAGGYAGCVDIDSAAAVGGGLKLLGNIQLTNILEALDVVVSTIENSDVNGCVGGYSVLANGSDVNNQNLGKAGGFIGEMSGTIIKNSDANLFAYIIGREAAGGYAGIMEPGNVASVLKDGNILDGLLNVTDSLANLVQSFIPIIEDSQTSSVPCGGAVRADGLTDTQCARGLAGGYVGYNHGGRILGYAAKNGGKECAAIRIRSVYGGEFAGGFTGLMETANLADTGNLNLLFGLLETSNVLSLLGAVYPTETNTAVYGPLRKVNMDTWNKWAAAVGSNGVYGDQFPNTSVSSEEELKPLIKQYAYGYNVKAGRTSVGTQDMEAGAAGGYVGRMKAGVVTNAHAWDAKNITAYTSAGGLAGEMKPGGAAQVGKVSLLGLDITGSISAVQTFVPVIRNSDITGFQSGMTVKATGIPEKASTLKIEKVGYAGGYVGHMLGGQIWGNWSKASTFSATDAIPNPNNKRCFVANLRKVEGTKAVGGFAGQIDPASAAALDTASSGGLLGGLLQSLIKTPGDLLSLLNTTVSTVRGADVSAWDDWGIIINGAYTNGTGNTAYAKAAGGFAGEINGAVIGELKNSENGVHVSNIRSVTGGEYAGGFFGLADVSAVAKVGDKENTNILASILTLGGTSVVDAFRTFIYDSDVSGTTDAGLEVQARESKKTEYVNDPVYTGAAGGFGGAMLNGSAKGSKVINLRKVNGLSYTGGFIGHMGKSGTVDLDNLGALGNLLSAGAGVLDIFGSHADNCSVSGVDGGFTVHSMSNQQEKSEIAGGFTGYSDLGRMSGNTVTGLKQVTSGEIAGGFAGKTNFAYLADINVNSELVKYLVQGVNKILKALWLGELQKDQVITIDLGIIKINALYDGNLVSLNLFGLKIKIGLAKEQSLATISIGDSEIKINCSNGGTIDEENLKNEINISLIKANRTRLDSCSVTGIPEGYDVYGGGAGNNANGTGEYGIAGGFVGWNNEGLLKGNDMFFADVIRGAKDLTGPFTGKASLKSNWEFNDVVGIEGDENRYRIYRGGDTVYEDLLGSSHKELQEKHETIGAWTNVYTIRHMTKDKVVKFSDLKDAILKHLVSKADATAMAEVYQEDGAMAVLMANTATTPTEPGGGEETPDVQDPCKDLIELRVKKVWKGDEEKDRPNEVVFQITRTYEVNGQETTDINFNKEVILTKEDAQTADIWEKVLSGPEYTAYHVGQNGEKYYYTYHISETKVDGYTTEITYPGRPGDNKYHYSITVINKKNWFEIPLPETGGWGTTGIYTVGVLLLCFVAAMEYRKRKSKRSQSNYK